MTDSAEPRDVRHCIKCGREVGADETVCPVCNRAGMATPSATQYHGTIVVAIVVAVAGLAWAAGASLQGVGPYTAEVERVSAADIGYDIEYAVTNDGTKPGRAKCHLVALSETGRELRAVNAVTPRVDGGESITASVAIPGLETEPAEVRIDCS